jgi:hypothetical protein
VSTKVSCSLIRASFAQNWSGAALFEGRTRREFEAVPRRPPRRRLGIAASMAGGVALGAAIQLADTRSVPLLLAATAALCLALAHHLRGRAPLGTGG